MCFPSRTRIMSSIFYIPYSTWHIIGHSVENMTDRCIWPKPHSTLSPILFPNRNCWMITILLTFYFTEKAKAIEWKYYHVSSAPFKISCSILLVKKDIFFTNAKVNSSAGAFDSTLSLAQILLYQLFPFFLLSSVLHIYSSLQFSNEPLPLFSDYCPLPSPTSFL